jgi:hypothetical protein
LESQEREKSQKLISEKMFSAIGDHEELKNQIESQKQKITELTNNPLRKYKSFNQFREEKKQADSFSFDPARKS